MPALTRLRQDIAPMARVIERPRLRGGSRLKAASPLGQCGPAKSELKRTDRVVSEP
jgi:hypothetical protein